MLHHKKKIKWERHIESFLIIILIIGLIYFCINFTLAFHNIDLIQNIQKLGTQINEAGFINPNNETLYIPLSKIQDKASDFVARPLEDYYIQSTNDLQNSFILGLIDAIVLGFCLGRRL